MKSLNKCLMAAGVAVAVALAMSAPARATPIAPGSSLDLANRGAVTTNGGAGGLATASSINTTLVVTDERGTGSFSIVGPGTFYGGTKLNLSSAIAGSGTVTSPFTFTNATDGTFNFTSGTFKKDVLGPGTAVLFAQLTGTYSGLPGFSTTPVSVLVTVSQTDGGSISESIVLTVLATPEPSTLVLACLGGVPFAVAGFRRWRRKDAAQKLLTV